MLNDLSAILNDNFDKSTLDLLTKSELIDIVMAARTKLISNQDDSVSSEIDCLKHSAEIEKYKFDLLADYLPDAVVIFDHQLRYLVVAGRGLAAIGLDRNFMTEKTIYEIFDKEVCEILEIQYRETLSGLSKNSEMKYKDKFYEIRTIPIFNDKSEVFAGMLITKDVTEIVINKQTARANELKYKSLFESSLEGIFHIDASGLVLDVNSVASELICDKKENIIKKQVTDFILFQKYSIENCFNDLKEDGFTKEFDDLLKTQKGELVSVNVRMWNKDLNKTDKAYWCVIKDNSIIEDYENKLTASEHKYQLVAQATSDGIWDWDIENNKVWYSPRFENLLEYNSGEFRTNIEDFIESLHPLDRDKTKEALSEHLENRKEYKTEFRMRKKSGGYIWILSRGVSIFDKDNKAVRMVGSCQDISSQKTVETKIKRYITELQRSNTELQQFAYVASHDLQEPLRTISSFLQLLSNRYNNKLDKEADEFINYAVEGAVRLQHLIQDLLEYSRVQSKGKPFTITNMNAVLEKVIKNYSTLVEETKAQINIDDLPEIYSDESQMIQMFSNIISNALKFRNGKPNISIRYSLENSSHVFKIQDNGIGIDSKYFDKIFDIFQRLHTREEYDGTGIGLSICRKIAQRHGGDISVKSSLGSGTEFTIVLPIRGLSYE